MHFDELNPPAQVKHYDAELDQLAFEINSVLDIAAAAAKKGAEHYRAAGQMLARAKEKVAHGQWEKWLHQNLKNCSVRQAQRWLKLAKSDVTSLLDEQWKIICGNVAEEEEDVKPEPVAIPPTSPLPKDIEDSRCENCVRKGCFLPNCHGCKLHREELKAAAKGKPKPPQGEQNEPGEDWDEDEVMGVPDKPKPPSGPKNGQVVWDFKAFEKHFKDMYQMADAMLTAKRLQKRPEAEGLRRIFNELLDSIKTLTKDKKGTTDGN
jgi:hypothetical protein